MHFPGVTIGSGRTGREGRTGIAQLVRIQLLTKLLRQVCDLARLSQGATTEGGPPKEQRARPLSQPNVQQRVVSVVGPFETAERSGLFVLTLPVTVHRQISGSEFAVRARFSLWSRFPHGAAKVEGRPDPAENSERVGPDRIRTVISQPHFVIPARGYRSHRASSFVASHLPT